jgi:glucose-1-phosphate thymidylyltransferase
VADRALEGCWCYAGDCDHLLEANRMILDELPHRPFEGDLENARIEGRVAIHPSARLERTTVRGPAVIGAAELVDTFVGPYTSIGSGASLEGAEIDHSIVLAGATIRHLGHRIETSIIGAGAEVARDYGMPAAVRLQVGRRSAVMLG